MAYEVLARKYRPMTFKDVVGQEHIVRTLVNAISNKRIHHAYIFSGTRGTGKTTMARLLAKALNCQNGPSSEICGKCDSCVGINNGSYVDVQEIDGASNRGIDEIRNLRENVRFAPVAGKYKVYIIDESHQITGAAFNALLKTLEEPPKHAIFILATTEPQSIPPTIASRCQKYAFRLLTSEEITGALLKILETENVPFERLAVELIAKAAGGSMRDAQSLLDQAISYCSPKITLEKVRELLGVLPEDIVDNTFAAIAERDPAKIIGCLNAVAGSGYDFSLFVTELLSFARLLMLSKIGIEQALSPEELERVNRHLKNFSVEQILRISKMLLRAKEEMRWSDDVKFLTELYLVKLTQPFVDARELASMIRKGEDAPPAVVAHTEEKRHQNEKIHQPHSRLNNDDTAKFWSAFISCIPSSEDRLKNALRSSRLKSRRDQALEIEVSSQFIMHELKSKSAVIAELLRKYAGKDFTINISLAKGETEKKMASSDEITMTEFLPPSPVDDSASSDYPDGIKKILEIFPGKVEKIVN